MTPDDTDPQAPRFRPTRTARRTEAHTAYLVGLLADKNPGNRWKAAQALGREQDPAAVDALLGALYDGDGRVRQKAIWALGSIGDSRAVTPLRRRYADADEHTRELISDAQELIRDRAYRPG